MIVNKMLYLRGIGTLALGAAGCFAAAPIVWTTSSLERIGRTDAARPLSAASISAARGESEAFQVIVKADAGGLSNVNATITDLIASGGKIIPKTNFTFYREHYVNVTRSSLDYGSGATNRPLPAGWYADGLIPFVNPDTGQDITGASIDGAPFAVTAGQNQPLWVELDVPADAAAGQYTATLTVTSNQGSANVQVNVTVWNFTLPKQSFLKTSFGLHGARSSDRRSQDVMVSHRMMPQQIRPQDSNYLMGFGLNTSALWFYSGATVSNCTMSGPPSITSILAAKASYPAGLPLYIYSADEIDRCPNLISTLTAWGQAIHAAGVDHLVVTTPNPVLYNDGSGRSVVDIWVILAKQYDLSKSTVIDALSKGHEVWSYNTLNQDSYSPKWQIDFLPANYRIQPGILNQVMGLSGLLYWSADRWTSQPWADVNTYTQGSLGFPGEGMVVYPGANVGLPYVVPSIRLKWLRDGADDFDYIQLLKNQGRGDWALTQARAAGSSWSNWTRDPDVIQAVRKTLGEELNRLGGGSSGAAPPSDTAAPVRSNGAPSGSLASSSTSVQLQLATNENATCRYSTAAGVAYAQMTGAFTSTGGKTHATTIGSLSAGRSYSYNVRCIDASSNANTNDFPIIFSTSAASSVAAPASPNPPNGTTGMNTTVKLSWGAVAGATTYQVFFGTSTSNMASIGSPSVNTLSVNGLSRLTTYYWRVVARSASGQTATSANWAFRTR